jgi:hypothetical protein
VVERKRRIGRPPTAYTPERAAEILRRLGDGESLRTICQDVGVTRQTVHEWVLDDHEGFAVRYARAKQLMFMGWAEELDEIAGDRRDDFKQNEEGKWVPDYEVIARSKLRIDTRKWILAKQMPAAYGDKVEITGKDGGQLAAPTTTINVLALQPDQREQLKQILLAATKGKTEDET